MGKKMENNIRFRNHISIVAERLGRVLLLVFVAAISGLAQNVKALANSSGMDAKDAKVILLACGAVLLLLAIGAAWQLIVWSKTYISIYDNTIVIERNTLNRKKDTIGIKNISNVNMERNLFEMLAGTSKIKLDTNSMSTANKTDVTIVLKKKDAQSLRQYLMDLMEASGEESIKERKADAEQMQYDVEASLGDMIVHGLFSINLFSLLVLLGCAVGMAEVVSDTLGQGFAGKSIMGILASILVMATVFMSALSDIIKGFVKYYDFKVKRIEDRLYIRYGFLKKVSYTIPVDKINALKLTQSLLGRMSHRYMAEIVNVGMGDDEAEKQSFLLLYSKKEVLDAKLHSLLPEFEDAVRTPVSRQPKGTLAAWMMPLLAYCAAVAGVAGTLAELLPRYRGGIGAAMAGLIALAIFLMALRYATAGFAVGKECVILANGYFRRCLSYVSYEKIQHVQLEQNFIAKRMGIQKGSLYLLASADSRVQGIPYFPKKEVDIIKSNMIS